MVPEEKLLTWYLHRCKFKGFSFLSFVFHPRCQVERSVCSARHKAQKLTKLGLVNDRPVQPIVATRVARATDLSVEQPISEKVEFRKQPKVCKRFS